MIEVFIKNQRFLVGKDNPKFERAAKLAANFNLIEDKLKRAIEGKPINELSRHSLALLLMMHTGIRVGNEDSAEGYITKPHPNQKDKQPEFVQTYGLTTLKDEHFSSIDGGLSIQFCGKKSVHNSFNINDSFIITHLKRLLCHSNSEYLFDITDNSLTKFIKNNIGEQFSPKDFRCMRANLFAWQYVSTINLKEIQTKKEAKLHQRNMFNFVSTMLNNTPAVCKKNYVSPEVVNLLQINL